MKKTILVFGLISGAISSVLMVSTVPFAHRISFSRAAFIGYTAMILAFLLVYFGIRSYRDNFGGGHITFGKAFAVGIAITLISCFFYVATWEILYFRFMPDFMDNYNAHQIQKLRDSGATPEAVQAKTQQMTEFMRRYKNPLFNSLLTFTEPFPVGLLVTLISAAILRRKSSSLQAPSPSAALSK